MCYVIFIYMSDQIYKESTGIMKSEPKKLGCQPSVLATSLNTIIIVPSWINEN